MTAAVSPTKNTAASTVKASEVTRPIVGWIVIEVHGGKNDTRVPDASCLLEVRPAGGPAAAIAPGSRGGVPAVVGQATNGSAMRLTASLAAAAGALEPHLPADLRPVDRVEPAQFRLDRHRGSRACDRFLCRAGDRRGAADQNNRLPARRRRPGGTAAITNAKIPLRQFGSSLGDGFKLTDGFPAEQYRNKSADRRDNRQGTKKDHRRAGIRLQHKRRQHASAEPSA